MQWLLWILAVLLVLGLLYLGMVLWLFFFLLGRPKRSTKVPKFYVDSPHYKVSRAGMALMDKLPHEDHEMINREGLKLHAHMYPVEENKKKFLLGIHGYKSYARPEFGPYVEFYQSLGFNLVLPDDRAHGPSQGKYIGFGVLDRLDCIDWAKWIVNTYGDDVEILLHGVSMGGATVLSASGEEELPGQVIGTVADCGFSSGWEILKYQLQEAAHLPWKLFLPALEKVCKILAGYDFHTVTAEQEVSHAKVPILFVQGGKDQMVPAWMVDVLYNACSSPKRKLFVPQAGHAESIAFEPEKYHRAIREFFHI